MIQETGTNQHSSLYIYTDQSSYEPLARIDKRGNDPEKVMYFHTDLNGAPEELTDENGKILWECSFQLWGKRIHEIEHESIEQNLRYQGQYLDRETGLHYNTFRYYDPDIGRFTQPDPIGLLGGLNLYQYAPNGLTWIDPLGLNTFDVGSYIDLRNKVKGRNTGLEAHHVGQKAIMQNLVKGYDPKTAPAILVPQEGHTRIKNKVGIVARSKINSRTGKPFSSARELLARDIRELRRVYPQIPNSALQKLIAKNKEMYPEMRKIKPNGKGGC
jgi:RHS repeat-associated protein